MCLNVDTTSAPIKKKRKPTVKLLWKEKIFTGQCAFRRRAYVSYRPNLFVSRGERNHCEYFSYLYWKESLLQKAFRPS